MKLDFKIIILIVFFIATYSVAQDSTKIKRTIIKENQHKGRNFVDANGDGYNDNAPDHDGDGIPNGLDPDYLKLKKRKNAACGFIDSNGDGINDNLQFMSRHSKRNIHKFNNHIYPQNAHNGKGRIGNGGNNGSKNNGGHGSHGGNGGHHRGNGRG